MHEKGIPSSHKNQRLSTGLVIQEKRFWWKYPVYYFDLLMTCKREEPSCQTCLWANRPQQAMSPTTCWHSSTPSGGLTGSEGRKGWWFPSCPALLLEPALSQCLPSLPAPKLGLVLRRGWVCISWSEWDMVFFNEIQVSLRGVTADCDKRSSQYQSFSAHACWLSRAGSLTWVFQSSLIIFTLSNKNKFILIQFGQTWSTCDFRLNKSKQRLQKPCSPLPCSSAPQDTGWSAQNFSSVQRQNELSILVYSVEFLKKT